MKPIFIIHYRLYLFFFFAVFLPQIALILVPSWRIPTFSFAFLGIIIMVRLLIESDKDYKETSRTLALRILNAEKKKIPSKEELESFARRILEGRVFVFYFSGALSFALAYLSTVV